MRLASNVASWQGSDRAKRLPKDWPQRRAMTKARAAGLCEGVRLNGSQERSHVSGCDGIGTDCDHDVRGDDHSLANLRWLSSECHKAKTQDEKPRRKRRPETHPGLLAAPK